MDWLRLGTTGTEVVRSAAQALASLTGFPAVHCPAPHSPKAVLHRSDAISLAALRRWFSIRSVCRMALLSYVPSLHGRYPLPRYYGRSDPGGLFPAVHRGSLIHCTQTSDHSVSNHLRSSARRVPLPQRWQHYFVRASPFPSGLAKTADRIEFTLDLCLEARRYGLVVHFQLLSTRGYGPGAVTFRYWPTVSARSGTFTLLSECALRRTRERCPIAPLG